MCETLEIHWINEGLPVFFFSFCSWLSAFVFTPLCEFFSVKKKEIPQNCVDDLRPGCDRVFATGAF